MCLANMTTSLATQKYLLTQGMNRAERQGLHRRGDVASDCVTRGPGLLV